MANFTAGTSFSDGVTNDVTAAKLNALVADAVPTSNLSLNSTTGTIANFTASTANITLGTIPTLTAGTTTGTAGVFTSGTITTLNSTTPTFLGAITASTNTINVGSGQIYKDASGNVGVGTASPTSPLHVYNSANSGKLINIVNPDSGTGAYAGLDALSDTVSLSVRPYGSTFNTFAHAGIALAGATEIWADTISGGGPQALLIGIKTAKPLILATNDTERLRIDSSGNVGVGTASPAVKLHVDSGSVALGAILNSTNAVGSQFRMDKSGTAFGYLGTPDGILGSGGATGLAVRSENILAFSSGGATERLRIDSSGNVGVGTNAPDTRLHTYYTSAAPSYGESAAGLNLEGSSSVRLLFGTDPSSPFAAWVQTSNLGSPFPIALNPLGGNVGIGTASPSAQLELSTDSAKKPSTNTWTIASDQRLKTNITNADNDRCYEIVKQVPLKRYTWRSEVYSEGQVKDRSKLGWIAQDVEAVFPKAVGTNRFAYNQVFEDVVIPELDSDGNAVLDENGVAKTKTEKRLVSEDVIGDCKDLNSDQIYAAMYGTIQKLIEKVEFLESKVATLEAA